MRELAASILIPAAVIVYLTLPLKGWIWVFKFLFFLFATTLRVIKWLIIIAMVWGIITSPVAYRVFGCTPLSLVGADIYTNPKSPAYAFDKPEKESENKDVEKIPKRKRTVRSPKH